MASTGARYGSSAASFSGTFLGVGWSNNDWSTVSYAAGTGDSLYAEITSPTYDSPDRSYVLRTYDFDLSDIPDSATIDGFYVTVVCYRAGDSSATLRLATLLWNDTEFGAARNPEQTADTSPGILNVGGPTDKWGTSGLTGADLKSSSFGIGIGFQADGVNADIFVDSISLEVYYTASTATNVSGRVTLNKAVQVSSGTHVTAAQGRVSFAASSAPGSSVHVVDVSGRFSSAASSTGSLLGGTGETSVNATFLPVSGVTATPIHDVAVNGRFSPVASLSDTPVHAAVIAGLGVPISTAAAATVRLADVAGVGAPSSSSTASKLTLRSARISFIAFRTPAYEGVQVTSVAGRVPLLAQSSWQSEHVAAVSGIFAAQAQATFESVRTTDVSGVASLRGASSYLGAGYGATDVAGQAIAAGQASSIKVAFAAVSGAAYGLASSTFAATGVFGQTGRFSAAGTMATVKTAGTTVAGTVPVYSESTSLGAGIGAADVYGRILPAAVLQSTKTGVAAIAGVFRGRGTVGPIKVTQHDVAGRLTVVSSSSYGSSSLGTTDVLGRATWLAQAFSTHICLVSVVGRTSARAAVSSTPIKATAVTGTVRPASTSQIYKLATTDSAAILPFRSQSSFLSEGMGATDVSSRLYVLADSRGSSVTPGARLGNRLIPSAGARGANISAARRPPELAR